MAKKQLSTIEKEVILTHLSLLRFYLSNDVEKVSAHSTAIHCITSGGTVDQYERICLEGGITPWPFPKDKQ